MKTHRSEHSRFLVTLRKTLAELSMKHEAKADLTAELQEVVQRLGDLLRGKAEPHKKLPLSPLKCEETARNVREMIEM